MTIPSTNTEIDAFIENAIANFPPPAETKFEANRILIARMIAEVGYSVRKTCLILEATGVMKKADPTQLRNWLKKIAAGENITDPVVQGARKILDGDQPVPAAANPVAVVPAAVTPAAVMSKPGAEATPKSIPSNTPRPPAAMPAYMNARPGGPEFMERLRAGMAEAKAAQEGSPKPEGT